MEEPTQIPVRETGEPRHCPECGSRVADLASECLMCGASLDEEPEALPREEAPAPRFRIPWRGILVSVLTVAVFMVMVGWLVRTQIIGYSVTPTPAFTATPTLQPTATPTPTNTPAPTPTQTPIPPLAHQVRQGETCVGIAVQYGISLDLLISLNPEKCGPGGTIRPNDVLQVPAATPTVGPSPTVGPGTPAPTRQCPIHHVVQAGETALGIAEKYNVDFAVVVAANPDKDLSQLQVDQVLRVPCGTPTPAPTATVDPNASPTPIPKYAPPALLSPPDGAAVRTAVLPLQWTAVSLLRENEWYAVRLRRLDADLPTESILTRATVIRLGEDYAPTPDDPQREYSWEVTVVRSVGTSATGEPRYAAASHPSEQRRFRWLVPTPTATLQIDATP